MLPASSAAGTNIQNCYTVAPIHINHTDWVSGMKKKHSNKIFSILLYEPKLNACMNSILNCSNYKMVNKSLICKFIITSVWKIFFVVSIYNQIFLAKVVRNKVCWKPYLTKIFEHFNYFSANSIYYFRQVQLFCFL